jgi:hypothetical protein
MTSPPTPPNRRRRKVIVAFALVLVSLCSWWYWPRGDARFVGKWASTDLGWGAEFHFDANGLGRRVLLMNGLGDVQTQRFRWRVKDNMIVLHSPQWPRRWAELWSRQGSLLSRLCGEPTNVRFLNRTAETMDLVLDTQWLADSPWRVEDAEGNCKFFRIPE